MDGADIQSQPGGDIIKNPFCQILIMQDLILGDVGRSDQADQPCDCIVVLGMAVDEVCVCVCVSKCIYIYARSLYI